MTGHGFIATIKTWRRSKDVASVLGIDDLEIVVIGKARAKRALPRVEGTQQMLPTSHST